MKLVLKILVIQSDVVRERLDVLVEFEDVAQAVNAVASVHAVCSPLRYEPLVQSTARMMSRSPLAELGTEFPPDTVLLIESAQEYHEEIPEDLKKNPELLFHVASSRDYLPPRPAMKILSRTPLLN